MASSSVQRRGIAIPFRIDVAAADVATVAGPELREAHLGVILGTRASGGPDVGELDWDPGRGSRFELLRNSAESDAVADFASVYAEEALLAALPDESLLSVDVVIDDRTVSIKATTKLASDASPSPIRASATTTIKRS